MSIQAMAWVLEWSLAEGNDRLVLLAIANHADAWGCNAWPSVGQIAIEARVSRATVFRAIDGLRQLGELEITHSGRGRGQRNHYRLLMKGSQSATLKFEKRSHIDAEKVSNESEKGLTGATQNRPLEPSGTPARVRTREASASAESAASSRPYPEPTPPGGWLPPDPGLTLEERKAKAKALRSQLAPVQEEAHG